MIEQGVKPPSLAGERCDKCNARAFVIGAFVNGDLYFCAHHAREVAPHLVQQALKVYDPEAVLLAVL